MTNGPIREIRMISLKYLLSAAVCLLLVLVLAPSAHAAVTSNLTMSPESVTVGEEITFTDSSGHECPPPDPGASYGPVRSFFVDDETTPRQSRSGDETSAREFKVTFSSAGSHTVRVEDYYPTCQPPATDTASLPVDVGDRVSGSIAASPDPPAPNQTTRLTASSTGGYPGYTYKWDLDGDGSTYETDTGDIRHVDTTFATAGQHEVAVEITDSTGRHMPGHYADVRRTIDVETPAPGAPPQQPAPPPPPCTKKLAFQLSEFTTDGCFTQTGTSPERWTTTDAIKLNGIAFADFGQTFTVTYPSAGEPGGHFTAPSSSIQLGSFHAFSGDIDWTLPAGGAGDEKQTTSFTVFAGTKILGLNVLGKIALRLGFAADGAHYATFPLNIELPGGFKAGPDTDYGRVTGTGSLRVDASGVHYDGLQLRATNVWLGKIKVEETCFSYIPAGGKSVAPCPQPAFDGKGTPYITCANDSGTDRFDGNAVVLLPSGGGARLGAFGGVAGGQLANLGATVDLAKKGLPIAPSVTLNKLSFGLCLTPPPLKIKGTLGAGILPGPVVSVDGSVEYTDSNPSGFGGWTLKIGGSVDVLGTKLGNGSVTIRAYNGFDFDVNSKVDLYGIASLDGNINGFVDVNRGLFNIEGYVQACVAIDLCAKGSGVVSTNGIAGCITITSSYTSPDLVIGLDPLSIGFDKRTLFLTAGFGYRWEDSLPDLFANSCNFAPYSVTRSFARAAAVGAPAAVRIARGTEAVSLRIHGSHGVPKVVLHGPGGATITSPAKDTAAQRKGHYLLAENAKNGTTSVILIHPAAGRWTVRAAPGTKSVPTAIDRSKVEAPPTFGAKVRAHGASRTLTMAYAVPPGTSVRLVERAKGIARTIAGPVVGRRCPDGPKLRPGSNQRILCAYVRFHPSRGPGGTRTVQAVVTRKGVPMLQKDIASFTAPRETLPSKPGALRARRANGFLVVAFPRSRGASRYVVSASMSDGRELSFDLATKCDAVKIAGVPADVAATVKVAGVRYDMRAGGLRSITVPANVTTAGPKGKLPRRLWKPRLACS